MSKSVGTSGWKCSHCGANNLAEATVCSACHVAAPVKNSADGSTGRLVGLGIALIGLIVALGPIAMFALALNFSSYFSGDSIAFWGYLAAFSWPIYLPLGLILARIGGYIRKRYSSEPAS